MTEYKNAFTADGRLKAVPSVTPEKVKAIKGLVEGAMQGDFIKRGVLQETLTTSDAIFSYAYLTNLNLLPEFDRLPRVWSQIAGTRTVPDFRKPVLYAIATNWGVGVLDANGAAPVIPEGEPYPYIHLQGEEAVSAGVQKRGAKSDLTFETRVNDLVGYVQSLPGEMLRVAGDTEEAAVFDTLLTAGTTATSQLAGGTTPSGATVAANAPISRDALIRAVFELSQRLVNGRYVQINGGYNLVVPVGQKVFVDYILTQAFSTVQSGSGNGQLIFNIQGYDPLSGITVVESNRVTGTQWFLIPKPGATGGRPNLELLRLAGYETPEIRVENATGTYQGGGIVPPFEGSFSNDTITFRLRMFVGGAAWTPQLIVFSRGDSSAVS